MIWRRMKKQSYNFSTAISMVVGIVIGSGIFFKADDILIAVNGNIFLGLMGFIIVGIGVLFGAITISYYSLHDKNHIGLIGYSRMALGKKFAYFVGWFSIACYFPAFVIILALVASIYLGVLLGIDNQLFISFSTMVFIIASFSINIFSPKLGGKVQVLFTIAKIIPLILIGIVGTFFFTSADSLSTVTTNTLSGGKPFSALIAIAFAFDGWIVATTIANELENSKKNLGRALAWGSLAILVIYCLYFFGITQIVDPVSIVELGDAHTEVAAQAILGPIGSKFITLFVIISVYGGLNGFTLAYLRLPKILEDNGLMKDVFPNLNASKNTKSILFTIIAVSIYFILEQLIDYGLIYTNLDTPFDLSSLPIMINYIFYIILFIIANKFTKDEQLRTRLYYLIASFVAIVIAVTVVFGAMQVNGLQYIIFSIIVSIIGIPFYNKN